ncbi:MAG: type II secretion system protein [Phycisphaerales bacterium]|nr:MAG: type II secretion system protein [Phycisphaerales bacterium]
MRKGFTLVELMVVIIILPFVLVLLDGLFATLLTEMPRSWRTAQESTTLLNLLERVQQDVDKARGLPAEFAGRTAGEELLLIELPGTVIGYQIKEDRITRSRFTGTPANDAEEERTWSVPNGKVEWHVWQKDGERYAVELKTHIELKVRGRLEEKTARAHLFFVDAF